MKLNRKPHSSANTALVRDVLSEGTALLQKERIDESRLLCEILISDILETGRLGIYMLCDEELTKEQLVRFWSGLKRLTKGEPLQYVLGVADFMGRSFVVNKSCLIPRPETEELVEWVISSKSLWKQNAPKIADVGTGSGCIAVTLAIEQSKGRYIAIDISRQAIELARKNALSCGVCSKIRFKEGNILEGVRTASLDAVISNPPYVSSFEWSELPRHIRLHEPKTALEGGVKGLDVIAPLISQAFRVLKEKAFLFMEIGHSQKKDVERLLNQAGFQEYEVKRDLCGKTRMVCARKPEKNIV